MALTNPGGFFIDEDESEALYKLLKTYKANTAHGEGLIPANAKKSFRRCPAPEVLLENTVEDEHAGQPYLHHLMQLPIFFLCTVVQVRECHLYDGSEESKSAFEEKTALAPAQFVQGWMEAAGSPWRCFHPLTTGEDVAEALCELWAVKARHWRKLTDRSAAKAECIQVYGRGKYDSAGRLVEKTQELGSFNGREREKHQILRYLVMNEFVDCAAHPEKVQCGCDVALDLPLATVAGPMLNFVYGWELTLVENAAAYHYEGDQESADQFERITGQTPEAYAERHFKNDRMAIIGATDIDLLIAAMLKFWIARMKYWRRKCRTKRQVQTEHRELTKAETKTLAQMHLGKAFGLHKDDDSQKDPLCRYVRVPHPTAGAGHWYTFVIYPALRKNGGLKYDFIRDAKCHEGCPDARPSDEEVIQSVEEFWDEDLAKAEAVRPEW
jgi:hypothetical protein